MYTFRAIAALREDTSPIEALTVPAFIEHFEDLIGQLDRPPIFIGHSAGGLFTQILLDHVYGASRSFLSRRSELSS